MNELSLWPENEFRNPLRGLVRMQRDMDRLMDGFFGSDRQAARTDELSFCPSCDIEETDNHYLLSLDLPGVSKNDVNIELRDNQLIVSGERKQQHKKETKARFSEERVYGKFMRSFTLPSEVNADKVEANFADGVLHIALPKAESVKPRQIKIQEGREGFVGRFLGKKEEKGESHAA